MECGFIVGGSWGMSSGAISCHDPFLNFFSQLPRHHGVNEQLSAVYSPTMMDGHFRNHELK